MVWRLWPKLLGNIDRIHPKLKPRDNARDLTSPNKMEGSTDDLKWFGEGFDGFPKRLPEDCVEYTLFIIDSKLSSHRQILSRLEAVRKEALRLTSSLLNDYIWHRDGFKLGIESSNGKSLSTNSLWFWTNNFIRHDVPSWPC